MEKDTRYMHEIAEGYRPDAEKLIAFIPWLESKTGKKVSGLYRGEGIEDHSITFPVYDGELLALVKAVRQTAFLDKNYVYLYNRNRIKTVEDEMKLVEKTGIHEMEIIRGILSRYILGGMTNTKLWPQGVENGIYLALFYKLKEIIEFWSGPIMPDRS